MSLSTAQTITLFQILQTPYTGDVDEMYGKFGINATKWRSADNDNKVQVRVHDRISKLTADEEEFLLVYIDKYQTLGTQPWGLDGGTNGINGFSYSPADEREVIREEVKVLIPVRHYWEDVQQSAAGKSMSVNTTR